MKFLNILKFKSLSSSNLIIRSLLPRFTTKESASILKNKDQTGESDKSYSGTDSKHLYGSDRVVQESKKKILNTNVDDSNLHQQHHAKNPFLSTTIPIQEEQAASQEENKTKMAKESNRNNDECKSTKDQPIDAVKNKQERY